MKGLLLFVLVAATIFHAHATIYRKSLAGPPEEFALHAQPHPVDAATSSQSTMIPVDFVDTLQGKFVWDSPIFVDSSVRFGFTMYAATNVKVTLVDSNMKVVDLDDLAINEMTEILGTHVPTTTYFIENCIPGMYWIHLESPEQEVTARRSTQQAAVSVPDAYLIIKNESPLELVSYANTFDLAVGTDIGLMAFLADTSNELTKSEPVKNMLALAKLAVTFPDGHKETLQMHDDGLGADESADDGIFVGTVPSTEAGYYTVQASVSGFDETGREFTRTTDHLFAVSNVLSDLTGSATIEAVTSDSMMQINVGMTSLASNSVRFYGELYGTNQNNEMEPICWIGGLNDITTSNGHPTIVMQVDLDWLTRAGVKPEGPFVLKNAFVQDVANWAIVSSAAQIQLTFVSQEVLVAVVSRVNSFPLASNEITERMRQGVRPAAFAIRSASSDEATPLVLLHGYCSPVNPFQGAAKDFTNPVFFLNANASIGHDDYSKVFLNWASKHNAYSAIGHSQGGIVLSHVKNYYWSGLDTHNKPTGRLVQTVASPFQGNSAAGSTANLGKMFGVGCGSNTDLTVSGSKLWLSGITAEARALVYVYTATYKQTVTVDYCNAAMNLVIKTYNDGVAELVYTPLPGAKEMGNSEPWCHSDSMKYTQTTLDSTRNKAMNSAAQR